MLEMAPNIQDLNMDIRNGHRLPADALSSVYLPRLQSLKSRNVSHRTLHKFLCNHRNLAKIILGSSECKGANCPLRMIRFNRPVQLFGGSSCLVGLLPKNKVTSMGMAMWCKRDSEWTTQRLMRPLLAGPAGDSLAVLSIQFDHHDGNVLRNVADACRNLRSLSLENKVAMRGVSPDQLYLGVRS
jgi:hypothetical protein